MKEIKKSKEYLTCFMAEDGTEFPIVAEDEERPTIEEIKKARLECKKYENTAFHIVLKKFIDTNAITFTNYFLDKSIPYNIDVKTIGSVEGEGKENFTVMLPSLFYHLFHLDYHDKFLIFEPTTDYQIELFQQLFELKNCYLNRDNMYCNIDLTNLQPKKTYFVFITEKDDGCIFSGNSTTIIDKEKIKEIFDNVIKEIDEKMNFYKNPSKYTFDVGTAKLVKDKDLQKSN